MCVFQSPPFCSWSRDRSKEMTHSNSLYMIIRETARCYNNARYLLCISLAYVTHINIQHRQDVESENKVCCANSVSPFLCRHKCMWICVQVFGHALDLRVDWLVSSQPCQSLCLICGGKLRKQCCHALLRSIERTCGKQRACVCILREWIDSMCVCMAVCQQQSLHCAYLQLCSYIASQLAILNTFVWLFHTVQEYCRDYCCDQLCRRLCL